MPPDGSETDHKLYSWSLELSTQTSTTPIEILPSKSMVEDELQLSDVRSLQCNRIQKVLVTEQQVDTMDHHSDSQQLPKPARQPRLLTSYSLSQKLEVLQRLDAGAKVSQLSKELGIAQNTISTWKNPRHRAKIMADYREGFFDTELVKYRNSKYPDIEGATFKWFKENMSRKSAVPIDGRSIKSKAEQ